MPRPDATPAFIAAIQSPYVRPAVLVGITFTTGPVGVWSGIGSVGYGGYSFTGAGNLLEISSIEEGCSVQARGIVVTVSGFDPTLLSNALVGYQQGLPAVVYLALFDSNGGLIPNPIISFSGRTDQPTITCSGATASISIACENRLVEMNTNSSYRRYTTEDQQIDYPGDLGLSNVNALQSQTLYWGRVPGRQNLGIST